MTARGLKDAPVLLGVHAPVGYPHAAGELPAGKILLRRLDSLRVLRVPGKDPGADRDTLFGNGKVDMTTWHLRAVVVRPGGGTHIHAQSSSMLNVKTHAEIMLRF